MDKKEYRYRKHISWGQYVIPISFGFLTICPWVALLFFAFIKGPVPTILLIILTPLSLIFLIEGILLWFLYYRMAGVSVSIGEDEITYRNRRGVITIPFDKITRLEFPSIKYSGGWIKIVSPDNTIRLTVVIQDIGGFLQELKNALDKKGLSNCYDRKKMFSFFKTAAYSDQSWIRLYKIFWKFILFTILSGTAGAFFAIFARLSIVGVILSSMISALWPTVVYLYTEFIFGRQLAKKSDEESFACPLPDQANETALYQKAFTFGISIYLIVSIIAFFFVSKRC